MQEVIIERNKSLYLKILIATILPALLIVYKLYSNSMAEAKMARWMFLISIVILLICLAVIAYSFFEYRKNSPALIINKQGITDNISMAKAGFIPWKNISSCFIAKLSGTDQFFITLKDFKDILERQKSYKRNMLEIPIQDHGTPIAINLKLIKYNGEKLKKLIKGRIR